MTKEQINAVILAVVVGVSSGLILGFAAMFAMEVNNHGGSLSHAAMAFFTFAVIGVGVLAIGFFSME